MTEPDALAASVFRHAPFSPSLIQRGREAALAAWDAHRAAITWQLDRSLDPAVPLEDSPPAWADTSRLTVDDAATTLEWLSD